MDRRELHGGSYHWWPPSGDHIILYRLNPVRFEHFNLYLDGWEGLKVLDVGCGGGYACEFLAQQNALVFGTDILPESLQEARNHAIENNLNIEYRIGTAERLPFDDQTMDVVTCFDVLEHIPTKIKTLGEIYRVLKPGGWLFFDTFNKTFWSKMFMIWLGEILIRFIPRGTHHWPLFISPKDLVSLLGGQGFVQIELAGVKPIRISQAKGNFPAKISKKGNMAIIYFGSARKMKEEIE
jgi:2-polyprenyl-6-hydroxyphenyl methylase/3-demethylubiquinone-9 3-methyltransferase